MTETEQTPPRFFTKLFFLAVGWAAGQIVCWVGLMVLAVAMGLVVEIVAELRGMDQTDKATLFGWGVVVVMGFWGGGIGWWMCHWYREVYFRNGVQRAQRILWP